jgi:hypothetical protein
MHMKLMTWMKHDNKDELDLWWIGPCDQIRQIDEMG